VHYHPENTKGAQKNPTRQGPKHGERRRGQVYVIGELADAVQAQIDNLFSDGVVTTSVVVGGIFLAGDQLFGVEQLAVGSGADLIDNSGLQIQEDGTGDVLA